MSLEQRFDNFLIDWQEYRDRTGPQIASIETQTRAINGRLSKVEEDVKEHDRSISRVKGGLWAFVSLGGLSALAWVKSKFGL